MFPVVASASYIQQSVLRKGMKNTAETKYFSEFSNY